MRRVYRARLLWAAVVASVVISSTNTSAQRDSYRSDELAARARTQAREFAPAGDPRYYASLRFLLSDMADQLANSTGGFDFTREIVPTSEDKTKDVQSLMLDSDPLYQNWLSKRSLFLDGPSISEPSMSTRSIGGNIVPSDDPFQSVALMQGVNGGSQICSAVLVEVDIMISAAHCLCYGTPGLIVVGRDPKDDAADDYPTPTGVKTAAGGKCKPDESMPGSDIGVLSIKPGQIKAQVRQRRAIPADVSLLASLKPDSTVWVVGFGTRSAFVVEPTLKNYIAAPVVPCDRSNTAKYGCIRGREIVSIDRVDVNFKRVSGGPCHGDSGGAVFYDDVRAGRGHLRRYLIGLVSRIARPNLPCGDATVYTLLSSEVRREIVQEIKALRTADR